MNNNLLEFVNNEIEQEISAYLELVPISEFVTDLKFTIEEEIRKNKYEFAELE